MKTITITIPENHARALKRIAEFFDKGEKAADRAMGELYKADCEIEPHRPDVNLWSTFDVLGEAIKNAMPKPSLVTRELKAMAAAALPLDDDDWGSEDQIAAQNAFFDECERKGLDVTGLYETAKMTVEEMVDDALARLASNRLTEDD